MILDMAEVSSPCLICFLRIERQIARISPFFPLSRGVKRVDDRRVISEIIYVIRHGLQSKDAPKAYGLHKTFYNRFVRWSLLGVRHYPEFRVWRGHAEVEGDPRWLDGRQSMLFRKRVF